MNTSKLIAMVMIGARLALAGIIATSAACNNESTESTAEDTQAVCQNVPSQERLVSLEARVAELEQQLIGGEITVERLNVRHIAARDQGQDPDNPSLIVTDALDRVVIGINGEENFEPKLGFFGTEPHPKPQYATSTPSSVDVALTVGATGLTASIAQTLPQP